YAQRESQRPVERDEPPQREYEQSHEDVPGHCGGDDAAQRKLAARELARLSQSAVLPESRCSDRWQELQRRLDRWRYRLRLRTADRQRAGTRSEVCDAARSVLALLRRE